MQQLFPIWQDYFVELNVNDSPVNYSIRTDDGKVIFYGKAWAAPTYESDIYKININKICENYLLNDFNAFTTITESVKTINHTNAMKTFTVKNEDNGNTLDIVTFVYDWSYDASIIYTDNTLVEMNHPINRRGKEGMYYFHTTCDGTSVKTKCSLSPLNGYAVSEDCNSKWALYYLNKYGGWDSYLIDGYVSRKDNFVRKNIEVSYNNNTLNFGSKPFMTQITPTYEIHTGWLNDTESEILATNLFQSTRVFLHNLVTNDITPVVISDADVLHKNHKNTGRRLLNYTINAVASQTEYNKN